MITCGVCAAIIDELIQTRAEDLFDRSVRLPLQSHGVVLPCEKCGRTWTLSVHTLGYEGDYIPEGAVLDGPQNNAKELSELEALEAMECFIDGYRDLMKGI